MEEMPLVSIVTPCYNDGEYIRECIESVKASNYSNIEHIVINDGSTDSKTTEILSNISYPHLKIYHTPNQGVCKARNLGIQKASGKYLLFVDGDDLISDSYISEGIGELEKDSDISVVACNYKFFGRRERVIELPSFSLEKLMARNLFTVSSLCRREEVINMGGFNENMSLGLEDWDFWINLLKRGGKVKYLDKVHFYYRIKNRKLSRNSSMTKDDLKQLRKTICDNHKELYSQIVLDPMECFEYFNILNSKEFKLGSKILKPIRKILKR